LMSVIIPNSVIYIGNKAFDSNKKLANVSIPPSVTYLGRGAFDYADTIVIGANVAMNVKDNYFGEFYYKNGRKAGRYTRTWKNFRAEWSYSAK
jgi:hypothetical protein